MPKKEESTKLEEVFEPIPTEVATMSLTPQTTPSTEDSENKLEETPQEEQTQDVVKPKRVRKTKVVAETVGSENNETNTNE